MNLKGASAYASIATFLLNNHDAQGGGGALLS